MAYSIRAPKLQSNFESRLGWFMNLCSSHSREREVPRAFFLFQSNSIQAFQFEAPTMTLIGSTCFYIQCPGHPSAFFWQRLKTLIYFLIEYREHVSHVSIAFGREGDSISSNILCRGRFMFLLHWLVTHIVSHWRDQTIRTIALIWVGRYCFRWCVSRIVNFFVRSRLSVGV